MNFPLFIARKINGNEDKGRKVSKPAICIATLGVAIGLAVMIVSVCVVLGFKHTIRDKVVGFGSHITVANFNSFQRSENYPIVVNDSLKRALMQTQGVRHVQRYAYTQGILKTDDDFLGVMLKGVGSDFDSTFIHQNMVAGSIPAFSDVKSQQKILLSKAIAEKLDLKVGDRIYAYFVNEQGVRTRRFTISGIYETNLKQFDSQICFTDLYTTNKLNGWQPEQCSGAEVQVNDFEQLDAVALSILNKVKGKTDRYGAKSADILVARPYGFERLDNPRTYGFGCRSNDDFGFAHHYLGAHADDWYYESNGNKERPDTPHLPVVCYFHHWQRLAVGQSRGLRTGILAEIHRSCYARP